LGAVPLVVLALCSATAGAKCPEAALLKDAEAPFRFFDVDGLHRSFLTYGDCDPKKYVELAESYADRIPKLLVERWSELERLDAICRAEPRFRRFVLRSIDPTGDYGSLTRLAALSASCEGRTKGLCQDIHRQTTEALREVDSSPRSRANDAGSR
jgi:hypothetical protein